MKIFVSYSRRDAGDFANQIHESLMDEHEVFTDINKIQLGDVWVNTIEKNISTCDIFVVIVTGAALRSDEVEKEVLQAQRKNKKIIPCIYRGIRKDKIKWGLEKIQGVEFTNEFQLARELYSKIDVEDKPNVISSDVSRVVSNTVDVSSYSDSTSKGTMPKGWKPSPPPPSSSYSDTTSRGTMPKDWTPSTYSDSEDINTLINKGNTLKDQGKYQEAIECYDKGLRIDPNNVDILNGKGITLDDQGKYQEAIECYDKALRINPNYVDALGNKGNALNRLVKYQEAIECYDKALRINPNFAYALYNKDYAFHLQDKYQEALELYNKALKIDPNFTLAQDNKKLVLKQLSQQKSSSSSDSTSRGTMPAGWKSKKKGFFGFHR